MLPDLNQNIGIDQLYINVMQYKKDAYDIIRKLMFPFIFKKNFEIMRKIIIHIADNLDSNKFS